VADWAGLGTGKNAERENIYKSRGPVGSKRAGGPRNGNDSLQGSLSLSLLFSSFILLLLLSFFSQKQLEAVKGEKAVKTPSSSLFPSSSSSSFLLFHSLSTRILTIHVKAVSYIIAL
jgi:hypothetical protein